MGKAPELRSIQSAWQRSDKGPPLASRLAKIVRALVVEGVLSPSERLPSSRMLAGQLGVARDTVEAAYLCLEEEGWIERRIGSGSYVLVRTSPEGHRAAIQPASNAVLPSLSRRGASIFGSGGARDQKVVREFAAGVPEVRTFPVAIWERLQRHAFRELNRGGLAGVEAQGLEPLRRAIADYLNQERGAQTSADRILILTSSQQALFLCAQLLLDVGDSVLVEDPLYYGARMAFEAAGARLAPIPVDDDGLRTSEIAPVHAACRLAYVTPSHQYPLGATLALERRFQLIEWAKRSAAWIVEDDYDGEFHYGTRPIACLQGLDPESRVIYVGTFSKSLFPGLRLGFAALPLPLVEPMVAARTLMDGHTSTVAQLTLARFIDAGHYRTHVRAMRTLYEARRDVMATQLRKRLGGRVRPTVPNGGLQLACFLEDGVHEASSIEAGSKNGIDLPGLSRLYIRPGGRTGWLLGYAAFTPEEINRGLRRIASIL